MAIVTTGAPMAAVLFQGPSRSLVISYSTKRINLEYQ